jgi:hypothetical protein
MTTDFTNVYAKAGLDDGNLILWNRVDTPARIDLRCAPNPDTLQDSVRFDYGGFFPATNHKGLVYAFQETVLEPAPYLPEFDVTLKRWGQSALNLTQATIGTPNTYEPSNYMLPGTPNRYFLRRGWLSMDGTAVAWNLLSNDRGPAHAVDYIKVYSTTDGSLLWEYNVVETGKLLPSNSFVLVDSTHFFACDYTSHEANLYDSTGSITKSGSSLGVSAEQLLADGHLMPTGTNGVGWVHTVVSGEAVDIYFNQIETDGTVLAWARAEARITTDWVASHLNAGPTPYCIYDTATHASVASWDNMVIVVPNTDLSAHPTDLWTCYWIDPSAGSYETSDPITIPGDGPCFLYPAGPNYTYLVEYGNPHAMYLLVKQPLGPNYVKMPYAPENAATSLRTLRELSNRNWNLWFTADGTQKGEDLKANEAYSEDLLGMDVSQFEGEYTRRMQFLMFTAATNTWRTDLSSPEVVADLGTPWSAFGRWQALYTISTADSIRPSDTLHPAEYDRLTTAVTNKTSPGRALLALVIDGSTSYEQDSGFSAWSLDDAAVPGIIKVGKQITDAMLERVSHLDVIIIRSSGYDTQLATTVYDFDGTQISVGGDGHRYGDDENDFLALAPTFQKVIPAVTVHITANAPLDLAAIKTAWFANVTEPPGTDNDNDMSETMLEGIRHAIGYAALGAYDTLNMIVGTDNVMKMPINQFYPDYRWPDLPLATETFNPIEILWEFSGGLILKPERYLASNDLEMDITASGNLLSIYQLPLAGGTL